MMGIRSIFRWTDLSQRHGLLRSTIALFVAAALTAAVTGQAALAASTIYYWSGANSVDWGDTGSLGFSTTSGGSTAVVPTVGTGTGNSYSLSFGADGAAGTAASNVLNDNLTGFNTGDLGGITFTGAAPAYTINGTGITIGDTAHTNTNAGIFNNSSYTQTFNNAITLDPSSAYPVYLNANTAAFNFAGGLINGDNNVYLHNEGAYTDTVSTFNFSTHSNAMQFLTGAWSIGTITTTSTSGIAIGGSSTLTGSGTASVTITGANNTYFGPIAVGQGQFKLGVSNAISTASTLTAVNIGPTVTGATPKFDLAGFSQNIGLLTMNGFGGDGTTGALVTNSTGASTLGVTGVTVSATGNNAGAVISTTYLDLEGGSAAAFNIGDSTNATNDLSVSSVIQNGGFTKSGAGTLYLSGANTFSGTTTLSAGTLDLANSAALQNSSYAGGSGTLVFDSGVTSNAFTFGALISTSAISLQNSASTAITLTIGNSNVASASSSSVLSGAGSLVKAGTGLQTLTGASNYTGTTTVNNGTLAVNGTATLGTGKVSITGGTLQIAADSNLNTTPGSVVADQLTINGGTLQFSTNASTTGISVNRGITIGSSGGTIDTQGYGDSVYSVITGSGTLTKIGTGNLTFQNGSNTFAGLTIKNGAVIRQNVGGSTPFGTGTITLGDTTGSASVILSTFANNATYTNPIIVASGNTGTATIQTNPGSTSSATYSGGVTMAHDLTLLANGSATTAFLTFTGGFTGSGNLTLTDGNVGQINLTTAAVNQTGTITNNGTAAGTTTISAAIGANVTGVTQNSATSALILTGTNTYTSNTTISNGSFTLNGGQMKFVVGASGSSNEVTGSSATGNATFNGAFLLDLSGASQTLGASWTLVDNANLQSETYGSGFSVSGFTQTYITQWDQLIGTSGNMYQFDESTGLLSVVVAPEPASLGLISIGSLTLLGRRRRAAV